MSGQSQEKTPLNLEFPVWDQVHTIHPLVIIGTLDKDGEVNFAPKHMVFPLGWRNYFGFVCTPRHKTYQNIQRSGEFTVTYPNPEQVITTSIAATGRDKNSQKPDLSTISKIPASNVNGYFVEDGYIFLECRLERFVEDFDDSSLILSKIVAAHAMSDVIRTPAHDDNEILYNHPQLAYISPGRYAVIGETQAFPYPATFKE